MSHLKTRYLSLLLLAGLTGACAGPLSAPAASPRASSRVAPTLPPPTPSAAPTRSSAPAATATAAEMSAAFPHLPPDQPLRLTSVEMIDPNRGWAVYHDQEERAHLLRTENGGATWTDVSPPIVLPPQEEGQSLRLHVSADFIDDQIAWASYRVWPVGGFDSVWRTTNGGQEWEQVPLGRRNYGEDWIIFDSVDSLHGWAVIDIFHGAGSHSGEAFRTVDGGRSWERLLWDFGNASGLDFVDRQVGWISTDVFAGVSPPWRLYITRDGGLSWQSTAASIDVPLPEPMSGHRECDFRLLRGLSDQSALIHRPGCATRDVDGQLVATSWLDFTDDGGHSWQFRRMPYGPPELLDESHGLVIGADQFDESGQPSSWTLYETKDGGRTWQPLRTMDWHGELNFGDEENGWGLDQEGRLWATTDGGANWQQIPARSLATPPTEDVTERVQLPTESAAISRDNVDQLQLVASLPAVDPTSVVIFRSHLYVGDAQGRLLSWPLAAQLARTPAVWRAHDDWVYDLAAAENAGQVVSASRDGGVRRWHIFDLQGSWDDVSAHHGEVLAVALSPDGRLLASAGEDGVIHVGEALGLQDPETRLELRGQGGWVWDLAFSPDGTLLASAGGDGLARIWSVETGALEAVLTGHSSTVTQVAFSPDGRQLTTASRDGSLIIWDAGSHQPLHTLEGHDDWVLAAAYAPAGDLLVSSAADGRLLLWDAADGELISDLLDLGSPIRGLAIEAEGRYLAAVADDDHLYLWAIPPG